METTIPIPLTEAPVRRRRGGQIAAATAAAVALLVGGVAIGSQWSAADPVVLSAEQSAAQAGSLDEAVGILGVDESLSAATEGTVSVDGIAGLLEEAIVRLEAAAAAGPENEVTQGLSDLASSLRAVQRGLDGLDSAGDLTDPATYLPLLLTLLQQFLDT